MGIVDCVYEVKIYIDFLEGEGNSFAYVDDKENQIDFDYNNKYLEIKK
jgi:hypothetical protein